MAMKKYVCIDTNIFIQCCLSEIEGDDIQSLEKLLSLLENNSLLLLLPEVVELEFKRKIEDKAAEIELAINEEKRLLGLNKNLDKKIKADLIIRVGEVLQERKDNRVKVEGVIKKIFEHRNTKKLEITPECFIGAYRLGLSNEKPFKVGQQSLVQPDALIIKALSTMLKGEEAAGYLMYFCSLNVSDFAEVEAGAANLIMHKDIARQFHNIKYYNNLLLLLNENFAAGFTPEAITKLTEKAAVAKDDSSASSDGPVGLDFPVASSSSAPALSGNE